MDSMHFFILGVVFSMMIGSMLAGYVGAPKEVHAAMVLSFGLLGTAIIGIGRAIWFVGAAVARIFLPEE